MSDRTADQQQETARWTLLRTTLRAQRRNLIIGTVVGLLWMVGRVSVPILIRYGIDNTIVLVLALSW